MAIEITDVNFEEVVLKATVPVMVDFWAVWCGPCKLIEPFVEELYNEYKDVAVIGKLDADRNPNTCVQYGVRNIPTLLFFKDGKLADRQVGAVSKKVLEQKLNALVK